MALSKRIGGFHATLIALGLLVLVLLGWWANDVRQDRTHTVIVEAETPMFAGTGHDCDTRHQTAIVQHGAAFPVRRIRYWKDCATFDVNAPDGSSGHFVLGVGNLQVQPPLR